jgi:hypothetical protein
MSNDPWAAASAGTATTTEPNGNGNTSALEGSFVPERNTRTAEDILFGAGMAPSLFTKDHQIGVDRVGVITDLPFDTQSLSFGDRKPEFWSADGKKTMDAVDRATGKPNRPVMNVVVPLATEYRFTQAELDEKGLAADDGARAWYLSGEDLKAFRAAIKAARVPNMAALVGMRLTARRTGQQPSGKGNPKWLYAAKLEQA